VPTAPHYLDFTADDLTEVLAEMETIGRTRDGWINIRPRPQKDPADGRADDPADGLTEPDPELGPTPVPAPLGVFSLRGRRPTPVEGTWIPGKPGKRGEDAASVGLEHPAGRFAVRQLRDGGCPVPEGWKIVVDHARRGLVMSVPPTDDPPATQDLVLTWLLRAAGVLSWQPLTGRWRAEIHRR
jgi:hypothetical protein